MKQAHLDLLVIEAQGGCRISFGQLYSFYNPALLRFAFRLTADEGVARDSVQEAWITLSKKLRGLQDPRAFRVWAFKTVRWRLLDQVRSRGAIHDELNEDLVISGHSNYADEIATSDQLGAHLARLPESERLVLSLFYLEDLKINEIAAVLSVPAGTVKSRLNRARNTLREQMSGEET